MTMTDNELAAALDRSQMTFRPISTANGPHVNVYHPNGDVIGRIYHNRETLNCEVLTLADMIVAICEDTDPFMLASACSQHLFGGTNVQFLDFTGLVNALNQAFGMGL